MSSVAEIRHHIKVVEDTSKITRAMYLISSSKMKKAMRMHDQNLVFFNEARAAIRYIIEHTEEEITNPYYRSHGPNTGYIVIAGDKGLCGGYNQEVLHLAEKVIAQTERENKSIIAIGHMVSDYFMHKGIAADMHYLHVIQNPTLQNARRITTDICSMFRSKQLDQVYIIYTVLEKMGTTRPAVMRLLPILKEDFEDAHAFRGGEGTLLFHPSAAEALDSVVPHYLVGQVYSALAQSYASEHSARMFAMDAATRNAEEMLDDLRLSFNHVRQTMITQEITEIISGDPDFGGEI